MWRIYLVLGCETLGFQIDVHIYCDEDDWFGYMCVYCALCRGWWGGESNLSDCFRVIQEEKMSPTHRPICFTGIRFTYLYVVNYIFSRCFLRIDDSTSWFSLDVEFEYSSSAWDCEMQSHSWRGDWKPMHEFIMSSLVWKICAIITIRSLLPYLKIIGGRLGPVKEKSFREKVQATMHPLANVRWIAGSRTVANVYLKVADLPAPLALASFLN